MSNIVYICCVLLIGTASAVLAANDRPVIGVLMQEPTEIFNTTSTYVPASYVKFVEAAGAQVVPIHINKPVAYYEELVSNVNGVLLPGGAVDIATSGYAKAGRIIFERAIDLNNRGDYFPIWGTCNGFEILSYLLANYTNLLTSCDSNDQPLSLNFTSNAKSSKLFGTVPTDLYNDLATKKITANFHSNCLTKTNVTRYGLDKAINILSLGLDTNGLEFISSFESIRYPFYATQFHPEKNAYEWTSRPGHSHIPHSAEAIRATSYFGQFFINEARKSSHTFPNGVINDLIYNYQPARTDNISAYTQTYFMD